MMRNAGILRKIPDNDDLYLTIDGSVLIIKGDDIPRLLANYPIGIFCQGKRIGDVFQLQRKIRGFSDQVEVRVFNLSFVIYLDKFRKVWDGKIPYCTIFERVNNSWRGFEGVKA